MSDFISRQAAIAALIKWYGCEPTDIGAFENIIEELPSAQPKQQPGEWVKISGNQYVCSLCGDNWIFAGVQKSNYCPNCGARMTTKTPIDKDELAY